MLAEWSQNDPKGLPSNPKLTQNVHACIVMAWPNMHMMAITDRRFLFAITYHNQLSVFDNGPKCR